MPKFMVRVEHTEAFEVPVEIDDCEIDRSEIEDVGIIRARESLAKEVAEQKLVDTSFEEQNRWFVECVDRVSTEVRRVRSFPKGALPDEGRLFIPFKIARQGSPLVSCRTAAVIAQAPNILCLQIDLESRGCENGGISGNDCPEVYIDRTPKSRRLHRSKLGLTSIRFHTLPGWRVFLYLVSNDALSVTLIKDIK